MDSITFYYKDAESYWIQHQADGEGTFTRSISDLAALSITYLYEQEEDRYYQEEEDQEVYEQEWQDFTEIATNPSKFLAQDESGVDRITSE